MTLYPWTTLASLAALAILLWLCAIVGRARGRYHVQAPAVTGHVEFEKRFRVQMNSLEQIVIFLPALWLCAVWVGDGWAAAGGAVWSIGRILYAWTYFVDPAKRTIGFMLTAVPTVAMIIAVLVAVLRVWL